MIKLLNKLTGKVSLFFSVGMLMISKSFKDKVNTLINSISINVEHSIPDHLINCIIKIEDVRFFEHHGVDFVSIGRAFKNYFLKGRKEGASTITQQLVRIIIGNYDVKLNRKLIEILLSSIVEKRYSKLQILNSYCHNYSFENSKGIMELCANEKVDINNLLHTEACQIAARFKYPYLKTSNYIRYLKRVRIIELKTMPAQHSLTLRRISNTLASCSAIRRRSGYVEFKEGRPLDNYETCGWSFRQ